MSRVFISYSHDSPDHLTRILELSDRLREQGVDCQIDQYQQSPPEGWPKWCARQIKNATLVLVACTESYLRRFDGDEALRAGRGGTWEGHIITQELYNAEGRNTKFVPIIFSKEDNQFIPVPLQGATSYQLPENDNQLYRRLTDQPLTPMPSLGSIQPMPALARKQDFQTLWQVPYPRNPFFTGREKTLSDLRQALAGPRKAAALSGLGGMGKTQTAIEYAYTYRDQYKAIFWVKAESRDTLLADFASIALSLNLPSANAKEQELTVAEVKRWLETNPGWLLILDNADDLALAKAFLPHIPQGHLLFTTRARALGGLADRLGLTEMQPEEGALLLLRRAGLAANAGQAGQSLAMQISQELGGLPLALDQAGAFIEETPSSLSEYLQLYRAERTNLLAERGSLGDHQSVTVTFSLAFAKVAENSPAAADLIRLCAFLAPDAIPEEIFTEGAKELGDNLGAVMHSSLDFAKVLKEATRFSLLDRDAASKALDIHRLVQAVVQSGMPNSEQSDWAERTVRAVTRAFPNAEFENWESCQKLLPHAQECASLIADREFAFREAGLLLQRAAHYLFQRALFAEAEPLYQRSLPIYEKALGPDHPDMAAGLNNLAALYRTLGKYAEAEPLYPRSLAIREKALGPDHPDVAQSLNNLAVLYDSQGKYAEAEPLYQRSLPILEKALGPDDPDVAMSLNNLAELYRRQGKYAEAEPLYQRSLAIREKVLGPDHPDVAASLNNLGYLYSGQGRYSEAELLHQRSLTIWEKALGPDHPDVAMSLNNLGLLYFSQGKYAEAEPLYQRSLAILEKALRRDHPAVALSLNNLGELYRTQEKYTEAELLHQRSLAVREHALGSDHPDVAQSLNNLALIYASQGNHAEAEPFYQRSFAIYKKALGPDHPDVALSLNNLASLFESQGKYSEAEPLYQRSLAIREKALGSDHPHTLNVRANWERSRESKPEN